MSFLSFLFGEDRNRLLQVEVRMTGVPDEAAYHRFADWVKERLVHATTTYLEENPQDGKLDGGFAPIKTEDTLPDARRAATLKLAFELQGIHAGVDDTTLLKLVSSHFREALRYHRFDTEDTEHKHINALADGMDFSVMMRYMDPPSQDQGNSPYQGRR